MKLTVTSKEINLVKEKDNTYSYRINGDLHVSNIPTEDEALRDAENKLMKLIKQIIKK